MRTVRLNQAVLNRQRSLVGRVTPCAPFAGARVLTSRLVWQQRRLVWTLPSPDAGGAHGVSRPTTAGFRGSKREISFGRILSPATPPLGEEREKRLRLQRLLRYASALLIPATGLVKLPPAA